MNKTFLFILLHRVVGKILQEVGKCMFFSNYSAVNTETKVVSVDMLRGVPFSTD